jgi:hypothetical protein
MQTHAMAHAVDVRRGNARESSEALALDARRSASSLGLAAAELEALLDVDAGMAASILAGQARIAPGSPLAGRVLLLVRLHRALGDVYGSTEQVDRWLDAVEPALGDRPRVLIRDADGLQRVVAQVERRCKDCLW